MKCPFTSPHVITRLDGTKKSVMIPCGCCPICDRNTSLKIYPRILTAIKSHKSTIFFTLTADDSHMYDTVCKDSGLIVKQCSEFKPKLQSYLKRCDTFIRRKYSITKPNKPNYDYYFILEYGPNTLRPHLHGVICHDYSDSDFITYFSSWRKEMGFLCYKVLDITGENSCKVAHYISKYTTKGSLSELYPYFRNNTLIKPWRIYSSGLGREYLSPRILAYHRAEDIRREHFNNPFSYITCRADKLLERLFFLDNNCRYPLHSYYQNKILNRKSYKFKRPNILGKSKTHIYQPKADTLSLLFELAIFRKSLFSSVERFREVATRVGIRNIDETIAISEKERIFERDLRYKELLAKIHQEIFNKKLKNKHLNYE